MTAVLERTPAPTGPELLRSAADVLADAAHAARPVDRYAGAHLAALRGTAAVLSVRARPVTVRGSRPPSAWKLLAAVAPEFTEWAAFFAAGAAKRAAAEAGLTRAVSVRDADDLVRQVGTFLDLVRAAVDVG